MDAHGPSTAIRSQTRRIDKPPRRMRSDVAFPNARQIGWASLNNNVNPFGHPFEQPAQSQADD